MKTFSSKELDAESAQSLGPNFCWGVATAAFQIEGAAREDGRGESIWDRFSHTPGKTRNGDTGDVACDHYHRMPHDVRLMASLGLDAYRFSLAWPRIQPLGRGAWNAKGVDFYDRLIDELEKHGLQAHATLYHWDLPQALQDAGGWASRDTALRFADYAEFVGRRWGNRLRTLATHNEPWCTAHLGHGIGKFAPGLADERLERQVAHHLLLSHGLALQRLRAQPLRCDLGIVLNMSCATAATPMPEDLALARRQYGQLVRWYLEPLLLGRYPQEPGLPALPDIEPGDMACIRAPLDFLGVNYYNRMWASHQGTPPPALLGVSDMGWETYPEGLRELLLTLYREYPLPPIYITENGMACTDRIENDEVHDPQRIDYVRRHLQALAQAKQEGLDVRGYFYWSLMDNFEWDSGYAKRFGLVHVNYATQQRTLKSSAHWYAQTASRQRRLAAQARVEESAHG